MGEPLLGMVAGDFGNPASGRHLLYSIWGDRLCEASNLRGVPFIEASSDGSAFDPSLVCFECIARACLAMAVPAERCPYCREPWRLDAYGRPVHGDRCETGTVTAIGRAYRLAPDLVGAYEWWAGRRDRTVDVVAAFRRIGGRRSA